MKLTKREAEIILLIRRLKFGKLEIDVRDGQPQQHVKQKEKIIDLKTLDNYISNDILQ